MKHPALSDRLAAHLPLIVLILCLIQPCLDVLSYWLDWAGISNTLTLLLRFVLLFCIVLLGFMLSRRRKYYYLMAGVLLAYTVCHIFACLRKGYQDPVGDLTNLIRIYQLPLVTLSFVSFLRRNSKCLQAIKRGFFLSLLIIALVEILATVTGTDPHTYSNKDIGVLGWFYLPSAQSAILTTLIPVSIIFTLEQQNYRPIPTMTIGLFALGMLYLFATRLAYAALLGTGLGLSVSLLIIRKTGKLATGRSAAALLLCACLFALLYPLSPMTQNAERVATNLVLKQENVDMLVAEDDKAAAEAGLTGTDRKEASLRSAYEEYLPGPTGRFGLARTAERYNYSTDAGVIADVRLQKLNYCRLALEDSPSTSRLFGLELAEMTYNDRVYDVENDFHGIYYLCGITGLGLLLLFLAFFLVRIVIALIRNFPRYFTTQAAGFGIALICCLAHAYFTAGVLRRPNTTFYLALVLAAIYQLTQKNSETAY